MNPTREDYVRAIYILGSRLDRAVREVDIAHHLSLAKSTVSERIHKLEMQSIVTKKYGIGLTKKGRLIAQNLTEKHRLIEVFLHDVLGLRQFEIHSEADKLEHAFSDKSIKKLRSFLKNPKYC